MTRHDRPERLRLAVCLVGFLISFVLLSIRAFGLHAAADDRVGRLNQKQTQQKLVLSPMRGEILDSKGRQMAMSLEVPSVFADPSAIESPRLFAKAVGKVLSMPPQKILAKIKDRSKKFVWLKRRVNPSLNSELQKLDLSGLHIAHEGTRLYPDRELAAQVIGVVGSEGEGLEGLERFYDRFLRSQKLVVRVERDAKGRPIFSEDTVVMEPEPGADLHLTIDMTLQHLVEVELAEAARTSGSKRASAVMLEPATGKVLAMASYPRINPNRIDKTAPEGWRNRSVEEVYEPGSTFKIVSLAAALEGGVIGPHQSILCRKGSLVLSGKKIETHIPHDYLEPKGILKYSDNIGTGRIAMMMGRKRMHEAIREFGFGDRTGLDFPGEVRGLITSPEKWSDVQLANIGFGQGIGVSVLQMANAMTIIANDGVRIRPYLVEHVVFPDGRTLDLQSPEKPKRVISNRTARAVRDWMVAVTEKGGTGELAAIPGYVVAGKTGTSQKPDPNTGRYRSDLVTSSFMGFAPADNPKLASIFVFDEPRKADYGSTLAAPVFRRVMESALIYLGIPPEKGSQLPLVSRETAPTQASILPASLTQDGEGVPDVRGLTVREVLRKASQMSIPVQVVGSGIAVRQSPAAGTSLENHRSWVVHFAPAGNGGVL